MVYPNSPFTNKFDTTSLTSLKTNNSVDKEEDYKLEKLLQWLCTSPKISSYRVNINKYTLEYAKNLIENELLKICSDKEIYDIISYHPILKDVILVNSCKKNITQHEKEIIVDSFCGTAILRGSHIFAPGILAMEAGTKLGDIVSIYVDIEKKCKKGLRVKFEGQKIFIGNGEVKMLRHELFGENLQPNGIAVKMMENISGIYPIEENNFPKDCLLLQNIPSILCGHILNPQKNDIILDMCASPGNKTTHLAQLIENQGTIIAIDKTPKKVEVLRQNYESLSLSCIHSFVFDSTKIYDENVIKNKNIIDGPPYHGEIFDKILLDAPCSNLGKRPQFFNNITNKEASSYIPLQRKLFSNAVKLLKKGGTLLYSTCTISLAENEGIVSWALGIFDCLEIRLATPILGGPGWKGTNLTKEQTHMVQRFGPDDLTDSVGFFIALFVKKM